MTDQPMGVDISKPHLNVFRLQDGIAKRFDTSTTGFRALTRWLGKAAVTRVVFEPTGMYHKAFDVALGETLPRVKVNPLQARRFAEAYGTRAKTDAVDARRLARMGVAFGLEPQAPQSKNMRDFRDLHVAWAGLIQDQTRLRNRAQTKGISVLKRQTRARRTLIERQSAELDIEIATLIAAQESTARTCEILRSMPPLAHAGTRRRAGGANPCAMCQRGIRMHVLAFSCTPPVKQVSVDRYGSTLKDRLFDKS